ncbi:carcinoembryonic antigen-related cell adhesion molecule 1-like [Spea bombifrons]|uniref:carcinoembryonic antigen-related cell adhesion molecule 1-like n=1 Tax=Spea bombifrons TaxID=233779 RepID=UPI00234BD007|nr:carcinoembryonic antigen-related cell adhesion molecule 1-like [Spea bombifrons]
MTTIDLRWDMELVFGVGGGECLVFELCHNKDTFAGTQSTLSMLRSCKTEYGIVGMKGCALTVLLNLCITLTGGIEIQPIPPYPKVNQSVILNVGGITGIFRSFAWFKGAGTQAANQILSYSSKNKPPLTPGNQYFSRAKGLSNGSLVISDLLISDRDTYTVQVQTHSLHTASIYLHVYENVTRPVVRASSCGFLENEAVDLTCDTANAETILWSRENGGLPSDVTLSTDNRTISFSNIKASDAGEYWCEAGNPVSRSKSDSYTLIVTCPCQSHGGSCAAVTSGIICGTILGTAITIGAVFLLYKNYVISVKDVQKELHPGNENPSTVYYNEQNVAEDEAATVEQSYMNQAADLEPSYMNEAAIVERSYMVFQDEAIKEEPSYMDLEFPSQDTYTDLQQKDKCFSHIYST